MTKTKQDKKEEPTIGSVVMTRTEPIQVGEVFALVHGSRKQWYDIIVYDKRLKPLTRGDGSFKRKKLPQDECEIVDESLKFNNETIELGDIICKKTNDYTRFGVVIGFTHPDGLLSTSYADGYNGVDMIDCVEVEKRGLRRKRDSEDNLKRFSTFQTNVSACEVDLWNKTGPKIITKT